MPALFISWTPRGGRGEEIAAAVGGVSAAIYPSRLDGKRRAPLRYVASAVLTFAKMVTARPRSVIVTNPPVFAGLTVAVYCAVARIPFVLDSHPVAFGAKNNRLGQLMLPLSRLLTRRAAATLVTTDAWKREVDSWGGTGIILHEAPPPWTLEANESMGDRPQILYVGIFGGDEPPEAVVNAATLTPDFDVHITGDLRRAPHGLVEGAPENVTFTDYLRGSAYVAALEAADIICALTTEPTSVMRAAYEAVYAQRPAVMTDTPDLRALFSHAVFVANDATSIAQGWEQAVETHTKLVAAAADALAVQRARWDQQHNALMKALGLLSSEQ